MGCISSKGFTKRTPKESLSCKSIERRVAHVNSSRREESVRSKKKSDRFNAKVKLIDRNTDGSNRFDKDQVERTYRVDLIEQNNVENYEDGSISLPNIERKKEKCDVPVHRHPGSGRVQKSCEVDRIAAGWPSWLASVAGEAIEGWVPRRANTFEKLDRIGQGTYSNVYKARDVTNNKLVALKKVRFDNTDPESVKFMIREILILRKLDHPNIIKLEGLITSQTSSSLYLIFEYMEHDLTGLASLPGNKFSEPQIKCYMQQLLNGLDYCHSQGVLHRDIKGSNLLIDDNGVLKIADFGLASFFDPRGSAQLTSRVVTLWYRAPELLLGASRYGVAVDLWSTGCILGELYAGKPILPGRTEVEQLHRIFKLCGSPSEDYWRKSKLPHSSVIKPQRPYRRCIAEMFKDLPTTAVGLMETLLSMDPTQRGTAANALKSEFFTTKPFASDPSSLPKYPPSKEIDAKLRDEEARRQGALRSRETGHKISVDGLAPNINPKLTASQKGRNSSSSSRSEIFNSHKEQFVSGFLVDPFKKYQPAKEGRDLSEHQRRKVSHSGPLVNGINWTKIAHSGPLVNVANLTKTAKDVEGSHALHPRANLSGMSGFVAARTSLPEDCQENPGTSQPVMVKQATRGHRLSHGVDHSINQDQNVLTQKMMDSGHTEAGNSSSREPNPYGRGTRGNKIYVSGPLLPSNNVEQILREQDRQIQEMARRRLDKAKVGKTQKNHPAENLISVSRR